MTPEGTGTSSLDRHGRGGGKIAFRKTIVDGIVSFKPISDVPDSSAAIRCANVGKTVVRI
jgi:hypothetical protein